MKTSYIIMLIALTLSTSCIFSENSQTNQKNNKDSAILHDFSEYGFNLEAPCLMEDVSSQSNSDFLINYGGITDKDDPSKQAFYQLMVVRLPVGYKDYTASELSKAVDAKLKGITSNFSHRKSIIFGYEGYKGYEVKTRHNNMDQIGVFFFNNKNLIIALTVISNNNLKQKFNQFTNGFKSINNSEPLHVSTCLVNKSTTSDKTNVQDLSFGYSFAIPCTLEKTNQSGMDYSYIGGINKEDPNTGIIYKVYANKLPQPYSSMMNSDKSTIKQNLLNYIKSDDDYKEIQLPISNHFAYTLNYSENDYKAKECVILTDEYVIELIMFSKIPFQSYFNQFIRSIHKL